LLSSVSAGKGSTKRVCSKKIYQKEAFNLLLQ